MKGAAPHVDAPLNVLYGAVGHEGQQRQQLAQVVLQAGQAAGKGVRVWVGGLVAWGWGWRWWGGWGPLGRLHRHLSSPFRQV